MRIVWLTDIHFDFASDRDRKSLVSRVRKAQPDMILVGGDTGEANTFRAFLEQIHEGTGKPLYFVLGNHDYYGASIKAVKNLCKRMDLKPDGIKWLPMHGPIDASTEANSVGVLGEGGWGDHTRGRLGRMTLRDYEQIKELQCHDPRDKTSVVKALGECAADRLLGKLRDAVHRFDHLVIMTHVPCWTGSAWHEDQRSDKWAQPFFVWGQGGDAILEVAEANPETRFTVLSGHSHSGGIYTPLRNVVAVTAPARYRYPSIAQIMEIE